MKVAALLQHYSHAIPRYTSYPTVPHWKAWEANDHWPTLVNKAYAQNHESEGISVYIHLPFCEALCTYCGCNKKITTNHAVEQPYIKRLLEEWRAYVRWFGSQPLIRELHLGGGTPTFFSPTNLKQLMDGIFQLADRHPEADFSFEGHPNNTTVQHLQTLYEVGFSRVSYGVQDLDFEVQRLINRIQPFDQVEVSIQNARNTGFKSVNFDLVYGLPAQHLAQLEHTLAQVIKLRPDRIAFYGYAHVPWKSKAQRLYNEAHLPTPSERMALYLRGRELFLASGYVDIGMDHFALPNEALARAARAGRLHRNFMGYTTSHTNLLIGLGVSAISDIGIAFAQNSRELVNWQRNVDAGLAAIDKGHVLTPDDVLRRQLILDLSCKNEVQIPENWAFTMAQKEYLRRLLHDGLLNQQGNVLQITEAGRLFTRNACSLFDSFFNHEKTEFGKFSQAV
jgi:oxygen-independent coproporphyrinogen-3 oxidase